MRRFALLLLPLFVASVGAIFFRRPAATIPAVPVAAEGAAPASHPGGSPEVSASPGVFTAEAGPLSAAAARESALPAGARRSDPRAIIASAWDSDARPAQAAFRHWTETYRATAAADRGALVEAGLRLAGARREELARLIVADPEAALAAAVPVAVRETLPPEVVARLEVRVSGRGELALNALTPRPGAPVPAETEFRSALIDGTEYRAYVYGRRAEQATIADAALSGIAVDRALAVAESPVRLLEPLEPPAGRPPVLGCAACAAAALAMSAPGDGAIAYEYAGRVGVAENAAHFAADAAALEAAERDLSEADGQPGTGTVSGRPSMAWTHGTKKVLLIRVNFSVPENTPADVTVPVGEAEAVQLFTAPDGVNDFFARSSFGATALQIGAAVGGDSPDVTPVLKLPRTAASYALAGDNAGLHLDARRLAAAAGFAVDGYDRIGVVFADLSKIQEGDAVSKITYAGLGNIIGRNFWINGACTFRIVAHELGHTYGARHANLWQVSDGDPVSESGVSLEYGDPFDIMGGGETRSSVEDFGPWIKSILQWIPDASVTVAESAGTYRIHRFDHADADLTLPRALKIVRDPDRDYWIGYRRATDSAALDGGAYVVWGYNTNQPGNLLDLNTPGTNPADAPLALGATFDDSAAGITLKPVAQGGSGADEWLDVQVGFQPRVMWVEPVLLADEQQGAVRLRLRRVSNSAGAVSVAYATEPGTAQAALDYTHVAGTVTWAAGDMADKFIDVPLVADALVEGSETFGVRLGAVTGGVRVGAAVAVVTIAEPGAKDPTFRADFINSSVNRVLVQPDGSLLAAGAFTLVQDRSLTRFNFGRIARYRADGSLDPEFNPGAGANDTVRVLARQADGRILVGGAFTAFAGASAGRIVRLNTDGSPDPSFAVGPGANDVVYEIVVQPDGRLLVGGQFTSFNGTARNRLVRLNPDGSTDTSFANPSYTGFSVRSIALQPDGKVLVAGAFFYNGLPGVGFKSGLVRLGSDGVRDAGFDVGYGAHTATANNTTTTVSHVAVLPDGRILVSGFFTGFGGLSGAPRRYIARLSATGAVDTSFAPGPAADSGEGTVYTFLPLPDSTILIGGDFTRVGEVAAKRVARLRADGSVDTAFATGEGHSTSVLDLALRPDGRVLVAGQPYAAGGVLVEASLWQIVAGLSQPAGTIAFSADAYAAREGLPARLSVRRTGGALGAIRVGYAVARNHPADTATAGLDYTVTSGSLAWADGETGAKTIEVPVAADSVADDNETFTVRLGEGVIGGAFLGERREAVVTIGPAVVEAQTISFSAPADRVFGFAPIALQATASSDLPVGFELVSGPATLNGSQLTLTGVGVVTVRAVQAGDAAFSPAAPVERSFAVAPAPQAILFPSIANRTMAGGAFALSATADSGLAVNFDLVSGPATLSGATLTPTALGLVTVRARQAGDARFLAADPVERSFYVAPPATVELSGLAQTYSGSSRVVGVATAPVADLAVELTYDGSTTPPVHPGSYAVTATIADSRGVGSATGILVVGKAPLTITANNRFKLLNAPLPVLTLSYSGLVGGDTPASLDQAPVVTTTATAKSKAGAYPITPSGGSDGDYALTLAPGTLTVASLAGSYEAALTASAETTETIGKLEVTATAANTGFSAVLNLADEGKSLALKGTLAQGTGFDGATGSATLRRALTKTTFVTYRLEIDLRSLAMTARVYRDEVLVAVGEGPRLLVLPKGTAASWAGACTTPFVVGGTVEDGDLRPWPAGAGQATATVAVSGVLTLKGKLADGSALSATLKSGVEVSGGSYRLFARPYGTRVQSYLAGLWAGPAAAPAEFLLPALPAGALPGRFVWKKGAKSAPASAETYGAGFALAGDAALYPWRKPTAATATAPAVTLAGLLRLPETGAFGIGHEGVELGALGGSLPETAALDAKGKVTVPGLAADNPAAWKATFTPATGAFSGSFTLADAVPVPDKPDKIVKRTVKFSGVLRQPPAGGTGAEVIGLGYFLVPPLAAAGETLSGEIRLTSPAP